MSAKMYRGRINDWSLVPGDKNEIRVSGYLCMQDPMGVLHHMAIVTSNIAEIELVGDRRRLVTQNSEYSLGKHKGEA